MYLPARRCRWPKHCRTRMAIPDTIQSSQGFAIARAIQFNPQSALDLDGFSFAPGGYCAIPADLQGTVTWPPSKPAAHPTPPDHTLTAQDFMEAGTPGE